MKRIFHHYSRIDCLSTRYLFELQLKSVSHFFSFLSFTPKGNYSLEDSCMLSEVEFIDIDNVTCLFACKVCCLLPIQLVILHAIFKQNAVYDIQVEVPHTACSDQCLHVVTIAENNESFNGTFPIILTVYFDRSPLFCSKRYSCAFIPFTGILTVTIQVSYEYNYMLSTTTIIYARWIPIE